MIEKLLHFGIILYYYGCQPFESMETEKNELAFRRPAYHLPGKTLWVWGNAFQMRTVLRKFGKVEKAQSCSSHKQHQQIPESFRAKVKRSLHYCI